MITAAFHYHDHSSYDRHRMSGHSLDWKGQPSVFKEYPETEQVPLPTDISFPDGNLSLILKRTNASTYKNSVDIKTLSTILRLAYGFTAKARRPEGDFYFRSAASAGALYPTELYVFGSGIDDLKDGLYHFAVHRHELNIIRKGDFSSHIAEIVPSINYKSSNLIFFLTAIFFRSAWKYRDRAYRYHLLDTGHVLENLTLALKGFDLPFRICFDFEDDPVNHFLGLDDSKEVALAVVEVQGDGSPTEKWRNDIPSLSSAVKKASIVSQNEKDYSAIMEMHRAGISLPGSEMMTDEISHGLGLNVEYTRQHGPSIEWPEVMTFSETVMQRRSKRNFINKAISKNQIAALLESISIETPQGSDSESKYMPSISTGLLLTLVENMTPGFYLHNLFDKSIGKVKSGFFTEEMSRVCLDQAWLMNAPVHFLFMVDFDMINRTFGPRGYRYTMMTAGRLGQRLYLTSTSMGLGCCGIGAFYDQEAAELLDLNKRSRLLYLIAVGPVKKM